MGKGDRKESDFKEGLKVNIEEFESLSDKEREEFLGKGKQFDRIRRVTGYLNPDARQWNDGKQEELAMRKKHSIDL